MVAYLFDSIFPFRNVLSSFLCVSAQHIVDLHNFYDFNFVFGTQSFSYLHILMFMMHKYVI